MDYMEFSQGDYGFAPVYETYEFNVGPDGFKGVIDSYHIVGRIIVRMIVNQMEI